MNEQLKDTADEYSIDLIALMMALLRHWKIIIFATVTLAAGAFAYTKYMITPMYASMARLYVLSKSTSLTSLADIQLGSSLTNDYLIVVSSRPVLDQVIADLRLNENYKTLYEKVKVSNPSNTRYLDITVTDANPERAKAIADDIADVSARFISEKMDQDPPSVIQYGYTDNDKVSPSILRNTLTGGFVGAFIAVAIVVIFSLVYNTIDTPEDIENKLGLKLIAQIPMERDEKESHSSKKRSASKKGEKSGNTVRKGRKASK